jgi:hypothetical protein
MTNWLHQRADRQYSEPPRDPQANAGGSHSLKARGDNGIELSREASWLWQDLPANEVLFCPISGWDLVPLQVLGNMASVFVLVDWRFGAEVFDAGIWADIMAGRHTGVRPSDLCAKNPVIAMPDEQVRALSGPSTDYGMFDEPAWVPGVPPWCRIARVTLIGEHRRQVWLVYFVGNCVEIYRRLFVERGAAPAVLWLECPLGADVDRWEDFISPGGEFGRVFTKSACQPLCVAAERCQLGWAQSVPRGQLPTNLPPWKLTLFGVPGASPV